MPSHGLRSFKCAEQLKELVQPPGQNLSFEVEKILPSVNQQLICFFVMLLVTLVAK